VRSNQLPFEAIIPRSKVGLSPSCGSVLPLNDGRLMWLWGQGSRPPKPLMANFSSDGGRTWTDPEPVKLESGEDLMGVIAPSLLRLAPDRLGMVQNSDTVGGDHYLDRFTVFTFHVSCNEGRSWSKGVPVNPQIEHAHAEGPSVDCLIRMSDGRLVLACQKSIGPTPTVENPKHYRRFGEDLGAAFPINLNVGFVYCSDDEGRTWHRSRNEVLSTIDRGVGGLHEFGEPHVAELADGRLLMMGHSGLGQLFRAYSLDRGESWQEAEPAGLADRRGPICMKRIPGTEDVLVIWNQVSTWESMTGVYRHRLSCAVSKDGGRTWQGHKNLESLDDVSYIEPPPLEYQLGAANRQPLNRERYHRAPGPLRVDHPYCTFHEGNAVIVYGYGTLGLRHVIEKTYGMDYEEVGKRFGFEPRPTSPNKCLCTNKVRIVPIEWLYE